MDDLTLNFVRQALINEEQKRMGDTGECSAPPRVKTSALSSKTGDAAVVNRNKVKCYKCHQFGHLRKDCLNRRKPGLKAKRMEVSDTGNTQGNSDAESNGGAAFTAGSNNARSSDAFEWILDSGASKHMTCCKEFLVNFREFAKPQLVKVGDGRTVEALGIGNVRLEMKFKMSDSKFVTMYDVLYVPKLAGNLFSVGSAAARGNVVTFNNSKCYIRGKANGELYGMGERKSDGLYLLHCIPCAPRVECASVVSTCADVNLWHQRLGHVNFGQLKELIQKGMAEGVDVKSMNVLFCEGCVEGKLHRKPFKSIGGIRSKRRLQLVHSDVCGPMQTQSIGGCKYFVTFIDDYTRCGKVYFMKNKNEVLDKFKEFERLVSTECNEKIQCLRSDNGGEYVSKIFETYLKQQGIRHETTVPHSPEQNGVAERRNRTLVESARSMLCFAGLPKEYWAEAINVSNYVGNRVPTSANKCGRTPFEKWYGRKPNLSHMRTFGCMAYAHIPESERRKLDKKAVKLRFIGYAENSKGYRLFDENQRKVFIRRDVEFNENDFGGAKEEKVISNEVIDHDPKEDDSMEKPRKSGREIKAPVRFGYDEFADISSVESPICHMAHVGHIVEPNTLDEALSSEYSKQWKESTDSEYNSLLENDTWKLVELPPNRKAVGCRWVFKVKYDSEGNVERFKTRLVAKGYSQRAGVDYDETFSPVVRFTSIRALIAFGVQKNMMIHQMDVETAFLNGHLEEEIYLQQPEGYAKPGQEHLVCKLQKSLYGLKQSPRCWNAEFRNYMISIGFTQTVGDPCVYVRRGDKLAIVAVYVDDLIVLTESPEEMSNVKGTLMRKFKMKDMGKLHFILGVTVVQKEGCVYLHQKGYIENMLKKFGMADANPVSTPADTSVKLKKSDGVSGAVDGRIYQSIVGSLLYAALATRPDISQAVAAASKFCASPNSAHLTAVKRILRYLKGTSNLALKFQKTKGESIVGYSDADWAGDLDDRRSTSGNVFIQAGAAVSWLSKKQATISLSTAESEFIAMSSAIQEAIWLKKLLSEVGLTFDGPMTLMEDNQGAIAIAQNPISHSRTKHIDIRYHHVRQSVLNGDVKLIYCCSKNMKADIFTKPLNRHLFEKFRSEIGLCVMM